jgi:hypothetical protein
MAGRPTKLTPAVHQRILQALRQGATHAHAAAYAGVAERSFYNWRDENVQFLQAVSQAEAEGALVQLVHINKAATDDWRAAAWILEHRFPHAYGRTVQQLEHSGPGGQEIRITYVNDWRTRNTPERMIEGLLEASETPDG